ncbi:MAG: AmmeMemoRadiSam system protein B [Defluviitaleaceae bacterium]|nr:AmmeMemoRadiSam system protein B [Defluviitaleaceae bacterium]MCL2836412.1 AmmeMemoRadiSam system protein B [Defluviitaleaceae bacterium]
MKIFFKILCAIFICCCAVYANPGGGSSVNIPETRYLTCHHFEESSFLSAVAAANLYPADSKIIGATTPHFLPVMFFTANLLNSVTAQDVDYGTVILAGPNHRGAGPPIILTDYGWDTPVGLIEPDTEAVHTIADAMGLMLNSDTDILESDHSLAVITPFIRHYLPEAQIVSIMLSRGCTMEELEALAGILHEISLEKNILLLSSVDFSHFQEISETERRDAATHGFIMAEDYRALKDLDNSYLDSPEAVILLMKYAAHFENAGAALRDSVITPESPVTPDIGYSYHVYIYTETAPEPECNYPHSIVFVGDILLDGSVRSRITREGLDSVLPVQGRGLFLDADIVMGNLEMPVSERGAPWPGKQWNFRGDPSFLSLLVDMNMNIVSLANNHTLDYGRDALLDTLEYLDGYGIKHVGAGRDLDEAKRWEILNIGNKTVAFLAASRVLPWVNWYATRYQPGIFATYDPAELNSQITLAKQIADYVVVYVHWGVERSTVPENYQRTMARGYITSGADMVIGSHPHVLQGFEFYNGKLIAYSLGNFIFTDAQKDTAALEILIDSDGSLSAKIHPFEIVDRATLLITDPARIENMRRHLSDISFGVYIDEDLVITSID